MVLDTDGNVFTYHEPLRENSAPVLDFDERPSELTRKRGRQTSSSLSSGPMPESEVGEYLEGTTGSVSVEPLSATSTSEGTSVPLPQGDACSSLELSTSGTLAADSPSGQNLSATSQTNAGVGKMQTDSTPPEVEVSTACPPNCIVGQEDGVEPQAGVSSPKVRVDEDSVATTSSEIEVISTCTSICDETVLPSSAVPGRQFVSSVLTDHIPSQDAMHQKVVELSKLLEAREAKLVELCRTNLSLQEVNEFLHTKLEEAGLPHDFETGTLQSLTDEFTERLAIAERKLRLVARERDQLRNQVLAANVSNESAPKQAIGEQEKALRVRCSWLESSLAEKEAQLADLLREGNKMAQEQLKTNNLVKTLRAKVKTAESEKVTLSNSFGKVQSELETLKADVATRRETEAKQLESINQLNRQNLKLEKDLAAVRTQLISAEEKVESFRRAKFESDGKLAETVVALESARMALSNAKSRSEAIRDAAETHQSLRDEVSMLRTQLEELRLVGVRQKLDADQRLQQAQQEANYYREQLAESESRFESLGETATSVAKPLLRQIESLQTKLSDQAKAWEGTEQGLLVQVADLKAHLDSAEKASHEFRDRLCEAEATVVAVRGELALEREQSKRLQARLSQCSQEATSDKALLVKLRSDFESTSRQLAMTKEELNASAVCLANEREEVASLKRDLAQVKSELATAMARVAASLVTSSQSTEADTRRSSEAQLNTPSTTNSCVDCSTDNHTQHHPPPSRPPALSSGHFASSLSFLQSTLRQREGEVGQLKREIARLNETHERLLSDLSEQTAKAEQYARLAGSVEHQGDPIDGEGDLQKRYDVLLQLYGKKLEENNELKLDLIESKEAYKSQLDELLNKLNGNR
ncbi:unnamed protein product [Mesocestoides corti]|nr:unnamed protein product [Mesocestoides corti]